MLTLSAERLNKLSQEVGKWADKNFKVYAPDLGMIEELGEAVHCILKRRQGIRGMKDDSVFLPKLKDALADYMIYMMHYCYLNKISIPMGTLEHEGRTPVMNEKEAIFELTSACSDFCSTEEGSDRTASVVGAIEALCTLAAEYDIDFDETVEQTWARVSKRDWNKNPNDADKVAEREAATK